MIRLIGIIVQGPNDTGFLLGLKDRMQCEAKLIHAKFRGKSKISVRRQASQNWRDLQRQGVDLVVRLTDSDNDRWQDVQRFERSRFPDEASSLLICGVTDGAVEQWLAGDRKYLEAELGIAASENISDAEFVGRIKSAIEHRSIGRNYSDFVRHLVRSASPDVFRNWLEAESLRDLYVQCRNAAGRHDDCPINDELRH